MSIDWIKVIIKYKKEIILLILTIVLSAIIVLLLNDTSILFWKVIGVPVQNNIFGDISTIPTLEQYYSTENIRVLNPYNENSTPFNYPMIWAYLFSFVQYFTNPVQLIGYIQIPFVVSTIIYFAYRNNCLVYSPLFLFSPPILLLFERGNIDGLVFSILMCGIYQNGYVKTLISFIASVLKVFPIIIFLRDAITLFVSKNRSYDILFFLILLLLLLIFSLKDLMLILSATPNAESVGFSVRTLAAQVSDLGIDKTIVAFILYVILVMVWFFNSKDFILKYMLKNSNTHLAVYVFVSLVTTNFAYRSVFLVPFAIVLMNSNRNWKNLSWVLALFWSPILSWKLFTLFHFVFLLYLPKIIKLNIPR